MDLGPRVGHKRVARIMRGVGIYGVSHRRKRSRHPDRETRDGLVKRKFTAEYPHRVWFTDIAQHRASDGWVHCGTVINTWSRRVVGWSITDHVRSELVGDA